MSIAQPLTVLKNELIQKIVPEIVELLTTALQGGMPTHKVEENLWDVLLRAGNTLLQAAVMTDDDVIERQDVADAIAEVPGKPNFDLMEQSLGEGFILTKFLEEIQRHYLLRAMKETGGVKTKAAELLGYKNYQTLAAQLERLKVEIPTT